MFMYVWFFLCPANRQALSERVSPELTKREIELKWLRAARLGFERLLAFTCVFWQC